MPIERVAVIFDDTARPETTGVYCRRALTELVQVEHFRPADLDRLQPGQFDLYLFIDDGLRYPIPTGLGQSAYWAIDTHMDLDWGCERGKQVDFLFAAQRDGADQLRSRGFSTAMWLPLACDPAIHRKHEFPKRWDMAFVGTLTHGPRLELIRLLQQTIPETFVGKRYFDEMAETYSQARLVFNRSIRNDVNMRVFEGLACGSLLITNDLSDNGQAELFQADQHLVTYRTPEELLDKVRFYLGHDAARERIADRGAVEAHARHTYRHRMATILAEVGKNGHTVHPVDARGKRTTYTFSGIDQQLGRKYPDGSRATFVYDPVGSRSTMRDTTGRYTYTFDELSRMKTVALPSAQRLTYAYDAIGQRNYLIAPTGGRFTYSYDAAQRIARVVNPEGNRTTYAYDAASRRNLKKLSNGTRASFTYDNADRLTTLANLDAPLTGFQSKYDYKYDPAGNRTAVTEESGDRVTWTYDPTYQLLSESRSGTNAYRNTFTFDSRGNRTLKNEGGSRTTYAYDAANQLVFSRNPAGTRTTYVFDANGNQQVVKDASSCTTTTWDYENQPTRYNQPANVTYPMVTMAYNADNQRVRKEA